MSLNSLLYIKNKLSNEIRTVQSFKSVTCKIKYSSEMKGIYDEIFLCKYFYFFEFFELSHWVNLNISKTKKKDSGRLCKKRFIGQVDGFIFIYFFNIGCFDCL